MKEYGVGLLGFGLAGRVFHAPLIDAVPGLRLAAVCTSREQAVRERYPSAQVLARAAAVIEHPDVDLVVVATPNDTHAPMARAALEAGRHVVVDKPMVPTAGEAESLMTLARDRDRLLVPYHNRRWDNDYLTVCRCLDAGLLGEVRTWEVNYDRFRPDIKENWREEPGAGAGLLYDLGPHLADQALARFGMPDWVQADVASQRTAARVDDYYHMVLAWGASRAILHAGTLVRGEAPRMRVHGTRGSFVKYGLDPQEEALRCGASAAAADWGTEPADLSAEVTTDSGGVELISHVPSERGDYPAFYRGVRAALEGGAQPPVPAQAAVDVLRVIEAAFESSETGRRVPLAAG